MLFGKKKSKKKEKMVGDVHIKTIPNIFYGGQNPVVYKQNVSQTAEKTAEAKSKKKKFVSPRQTGASISQKKSSKLFWILVILGLVILVGGVTAYYTKDLWLGGEEKTQAPVQEKEEVKEEKEEEEVKEEKKEDDVVIVEDPTPTSTPSLLIAIDFPALNNFDTSDIDSDELTDVEEEIFGTDSGNWDSDDDGYYDGQEVFNLYNPGGFAPVKIIDSGIVREYIHSNRAYRFYYPNNWVVGSVDSAGDQVLVSAPSGEYIEVRSFAKATSETFNSWFGKNASKQKITDLESFSSRFQVESKVRRDSLVAYFETNTHIFVMIYHPLDSGPIFFRRVMQMMTQSFRPAGVVEEIPDQPLLPGTIITTSTIEEAIEVSESVTTTPATITIPSGPPQF